MSRLPRRATTRRRLAALLAGLAIVAPFATAAPAAADTTYVVTVFANELYGHTPDFQTRSSPDLPAGASLDGRVTCTEVYVPGTSETQTESVYGDPNVSSFGLDAGSYQLVTDSCSSDPNDPLTLNGAAGAIQLIGGTYTIGPDPTAVQVAAAEGGTAGNPTVSFTAEVIDEPLDDSPLPGQTVTFGYQTAGGYTRVDGCSAVTTSNGNGQAFATCDLAAADAAEFVKGTGVWQANYAGATNYLGSSGHGQLPASTSLAQAAANLQDALTNNSVQVVETVVPPNCHPSYDYTDVSLFGTSLDQLSCTQLQVLQTATGICLGAATIVGGGAPVDIFVSVDTVSLEAATAGTNATEAAVLDEAFDSAIDEEINFVGD